jgi:divalent metal cation (Fe/Co/Zn/Cd) transporter
MPTASTVRPLLPLAEDHERDRARLVQRARLLARLGIAWHGVEAAVAIAAGIVAGSIALVGFGADSLIESVAGFVLLWRFAGVRASSEDAERRAQKLIGVSFFVLATYVAVEAVRNLLMAAHPNVSYLGIGLSIVTLLAMPPLAIAKGRIGDRLGSAATRSEGRQNMLCAYLSAALLVGLSANAIFGAWWADPVTGLLIAGIAVREGRGAWQGDSCCAPAIPAGDSCSDGCCD